MTTLATRPPAADTSTVHDIPVNPHRWLALTYLTAAVFSAAGLGWTVYTGSAYPQAPFLLFALFAVLTCWQGWRFNRFAAATDPFHQP